MRFDCNKWSREFSDWRRKRYVRRLEKAMTWRTWYAWWPTQIAPKQCVWLETIERRGKYKEYALFGHIWVWEYR